MSNAFANDQFGDELPLDAEASKNTWILFSVLFALVTLAYGNTLLYTATFWSDPLYSHGWLIPAFAAFLFYSRRQPLTEVSSKERWIGVAAMFLFLNIRWMAAVFDINPVIRLTYIGVLLGLVMLIGGWRMLVWAGPAVAFLFFMFPLPSVFENNVLIGLQKAATAASTWVLQLLGIAAVRDGNRILIDEMELGVVDACSGLRMLTIFVAMSVALAMLVDRPWWDRLTILVASVPIAVITNIIRIVITALLYNAFGMDNELLKLLIHDYAGFAMMPIAMGFLLIEFALLTHLTIPIDHDEEYSSFGTAAG